MEPEQRCEYDDLQIEVIKKLRHHACIDDRNARHVFQYLILPSFTPPVAWDVFRRPRMGHGDDHVLLRSSWRSDLDRAKLKTPVERVRHPRPLIPSIEVHELPTVSEELARLATELGTLELRVGARPAVHVIDGVTFEIAMEQPAHFSALTARCRLSWWNQPPESWGTLTAWLKRAEDMFASAWGARGDAGPVPFRIRVIDDAAARHEAQRLFHTGHYARVAEMLADVAARETLTPAETKMLELALERTGGGAGGTIAG